MGGFVIAAQHLPYKIYNKYVKYIFLSSLENNLHQTSFLFSSAKGLLSGAAADCLSQPDKRAPLTSVSSGKPWGWAEGRKKAEGRAG